MLYTKNESSGPCSFRKEDFWKLHFKNIFLTPWPTYARCIKIAKMLTDDARRMTTDDGQRPVTIAHHEHIVTYCFTLWPTYVTNWNGQRSQWCHLQRTTNVVHQILVEDLWMMLYIKYESCGPCSFRQEDVWKLHFENLMFDPVTYLCNQVERYEQLW